MPLCQVTAHSVASVSLTIRVHKHQARWWRLDEKQYFEFEFFRMHCGTDQWRYPCERTCNRHVTICKSVHSLWFAGLGTACFRSWQNTASLKISLVDLFYQILGQPVSTFLCYVLATVCNKTHLRRCWFHFFLPFMAAMKKYFNLHGADCSHRRL